MFNVRLAGDHLYGKWLFAWLSLVMSLMMSYFVLSFSHEMSWMRSGTEFSQFLRLFLPTSFNLHNSRAKAWCSCSRRWRGLFGLIRV